MSAHTPERIRVTAQGSHIVSVDDGRICAAPEHMKNWRWPANARRIVACWNACDGIDTETLEAHGLASVTTKLLKANAQRDELLAALKEIEESTHDGGALACARAAIQKVEAGQ